MAHIQSAIPNGISHAHRCRARHALRLVTKRSLAVHLDERRVKRRQPNKPVKHKHTKYAMLTGLKILSSLLLSIFVGLEAAGEHLMNFKFTNCSSLYVL